MFPSNAPDDTFAIGRMLGEALRPGDVVALTGDLGAGKTLFCKGIGEALGILPERIASPTYTMITEHEGRVRLVHADVYRLDSVREAEEIGLHEILAGSDAVCVVEWAEKVAEILPTNCIRVTLSISGEDRRSVAVSAPDRPELLDLQARYQRFHPGG